MLVKIGLGHSINMTGIKQVNCQTEEQITYEGGGLFSRGNKVVTDKYYVTTVYFDGDGKEQSFKLGVSSAQRAQEVWREVLDQVKELESVGATQALERAIQDA